MFYLFLFLLFCLISFVEIFNNSKYSKELYLFTVLILLFISGLRYETGGDWQSYTEIFSIIEPFDELVNGKGSTFVNHNIEFGFRLLISLAKMIVDDCQFFFFMISSISIFLLYKSLAYYTPYPQLSLILYFSILFFMLDMVAIRQGVAVMIFLFSLRFVHKKDFKRYFIAIIIASSFHLTSLLLLPLYLFLNKRFNSITIISFFIISCLIMILNIRWLHSILTFILPLFLGPIALKMQVYSADVGRGVSVGFFINMLLFILYYFNRVKLRKNPYFDLFFNLFLLYVFIYSALFELFEVSNRFRLYFSISQIVLLPMLVFTYKKSLNKLLVFMFVVFFSFFSGRHVFLEQIGGIAYNPYQNYLIYKAFDLESTGTKRLEISDQNYDNKKSNK